MTEGSAKARISTLARVFAVAALSVAGAGCGTFTEEPFLVSGTLDGAEVRFTTNRALADNIARRHCGQYERDARFIGYGNNTAYYECDRR